MPVFLKKSNFSENEITKLSNRKIQGEVQPSFEGIVQEEKNTS